MKYIVLLIMVSPFLGKAQLEVAQSYSDGHKHYTFNIKGDQQIFDWGNLTASNNGSGTIFQIRNNTGQIIIIEDIYQKDGTISWYQMNSFRTILPDSIYKLKTRTTSRIGPFNCPLTITYRIGRIRKKTVIKTQGKYYDAGKESKTIKTKKKDHFPATDIATIGATYLLGIYDGISNVTHRSEIIVTSQGKSIERFKVEFDDEVFYQIKASDFEILKVTIQFDSLSIFHREVFTNRARVGDSSKYLIIRLDEPDSMPFYYDTWKKTRLNVLIDVFNICSDSVIGNTEFKEISQYLESSNIKLKQINHLNYTIIKAKGIEALDLENVLKGFNENLHVEPVAHLQTQSESGSLGGYTSISNKVLVKFNNEVSEDWINDAFERLKIRSYVKTNDGFKISFNSILTEKNQIILDSLWSFVQVKSLTQLFSREPDLD